MYFKKIPVNTIKKIDESLESKIIKKDQDFIHDDISVSFYFFGKNLHSQLKKNIKFLELFYENVLNEKIADFVAYDIEEIDGREIVVEPTIFNNISKYWNKVISEVFKDYKADFDYSAKIYSDKNSLLIHNPLSHLNNSYFRLSLFKDIKNKNYFADIALLEKSFTEEKAKEIFLKILQRFLFYVIKEINNNTLFEIKVKSKIKPIQKIYIKSDKIYLSRESISEEIKILLEDLNFLFFKMQEMPTVYALKRGMYTKTFIRKMIALTEIV